MLSGRRRSGEGGSRPPAPTAGPRLPAPAPGRPGKRSPAWPGEGAAGDGPPRHLPVPGQWDTSRLRRQSTPEDREWPRPPGPGSARRAPPLRSLLLRSFVSAVAHAARVRPDRGPSTWVWCSHSFPVIPSPSSSRKEKLGNGEPSPIPPAPKSSPEDPWHRGVFLGGSSRSLGTPHRDTHPQLPASPPVPPVKPLHVVRAGERSEFR